jgi:hypothetical protein
VYAYYLHISIITSGWTIIYIVNVDMSMAMTTTMMISNAITMTMTPFITITMTMMWFENVIAIILCKLFVSRPNQDKQSTHSLWSWFINCFSRVAQEDNNPSQHKHTMRQNIRKHIDDQISHSLCKGVGASLLLVGMLFCSGLVCSFAMGEMKILNQLQREWEPYVCWLVCSFVMGWYALLQWERCSFSTTSKESRSLAYVGW